jgi:hypothetical protein
MNKPILILFLVFASMGYMQPVLAHPGNTASDGCHYCRTNCVKWGEVSGARHCHGGGSYSPPSRTVPLAPKEISRPINIASPTPSLLVPSQSPSVRGEIDDTSSLPGDISEAPSSEGATTADSSFLAWAAGILAVCKSE